MSEIERARNIKATKKLSDEKFRDSVKKNAKRDFQAAINDKNQKLWKKKAEEWFDFAAGGDGMDTGQWSEEDLETLESQGRPPVTFNSIEKLIQGIVGTEINNRLQPFFSAREKNDTAIAQAMQEVGNWARDNNVEEEDTEAFEHAVICGMGWTNTTMEYDSDPDGKLTVVNMDPLRFVWDAKSKRPGLMDSRFRGYVQTMTEDDFDIMFPDNEGEGENSVFGEVDFRRMEGSGAKSTDDYNNPSVNEGEEQAQEGDVQVYQHQFFVHEPIYKVRNSQGEIKELDQDEFTELKKNAKAKGNVMISMADPPQENGIPFRKDVEKIYYNAFFTGDKLLDLDVSSWRKGFTFQCITGRRDHMKGTYYGLVKPMMDPQRWANKFFSQTIHNYNTAIKSRLWAEEGAVENIDELSEKIAGPDIVVFNDGAIAGKKIMQPQQITFDPGLFNMFQFAFNIGPAVTGMSDEFIGIAGRDQPIGLEQTRKLATMSVMAKIFSSYRLYKKNSGALLVNYMQEFFTIATMTRVVSDVLKPVVPLIKKIDNWKFDVHVDAAPLSPSTKATVFSVMKDFLQFMPTEMQSLYLPEFIRNSPLPAKLASTVADAMEKKAQPDPEAKAKANAVFRAELEKLVSETVENNMNALWLNAKANAESAKIGLEGEKIDQKETDSQRDLIQTVLQTQAAILSKSQN